MIRKKVDFIGVGFGRCGTTTISTLLDEHPDICLSIPKETVHLSNPEAIWESDPSKPDHQKSYELYFQHFNHAKCHQIIGEYSPQYALSELAAQRISSSFPNVKLIFALRNPCDRLYSQYLRLRYYYKVIDVPIIEAMDKQPGMLERCFYHKHISLYLNYFRMDQMKFVVFDDLRKNTLKTIQDIYAFLNVDQDYEPKSIQIKFNTSTKIRFKWLLRFEKQFIDRLSQSGNVGMIQFLRKLGINKLYKSVNRQTIKYPSLKAEERLHIQNLVREDVTRLSKLLDKNFNHWLSNPTDQLKI